MTPAQLAAREARRKRVQRAKAVEEEVTASIMLSEDERQALEAVRRGCALLDDHHPGWADEIDLEVFDISNGSQCVIGQVYGSWSTEAFHRSGLYASAKSAYKGFFGMFSRRSRPVRLGFAIPHDSQRGYIMDPEYGMATEWVPLQKAWIDAIQARQTR
jgi:hypothetical protein